MYEMEIGGGLGGCVGVGVGVCCTCLHIWVLFLSFFGLCRILDSSCGIPR